MIRVIVYIVNGALIVVCCWLAAGVAVAIHASASAPSVSAPAPAPSLPLHSRSWDDRQKILSRNLFEASTLAPALSVVADEERYAKTKLSLKLLGTAASSIASESTAAVEDLKERRHDVVRVGSEIQGAKVIAIDPRRIVLENRGKREELALEEDPPPARGAPRPTARRAPTRPARAAAVRNIGRNRFQVDQGAVDELAENPAALFSQARIIPKYEGGQMMGVQLNAIKPGSLFEQAGLQNGDTVTVLNGIAANSQQGSQQMLQQLRTADEWTLTVVDQNGTEKTIDFVK